MSAAIVALAAFAATGQAALPPGIHCTPATAENRLTPPPPPWQLNHEPKPAHTPPLGQVTSATPNVEYTAEIGWHRDEGFGSGSRLFTYINKDKYGSNGQPGGDCYNCITMQEGAPYTLNQELTVGTKYQFSLDYSGGNWWFGVGSTWIGHESGAFWSGKFTSATWLTVHGEVYDTTGPNSQMGNGTIGTTTGSLTMGNPVLYKAKGELFTTKGHAPRKKIHTPAIYRRTT